MLSPSERKGLEEQVRLDKEQIDREWAKELPNIKVMERLQEHIDFCKARLE